MELFFNSSELLEDGRLPLNVLCCQEKGNDGYHSHDFIELVLVTRGRGKHHLARTSSDGKPLDDLVTEISVGDAFVIHQGTWHTYSDCDNLFIFNVIFQEDLIAADLPELMETPRLAELFQASAKSPWERIRTSPLTARNAAGLLNKIIVELIYRRSSYRLSVKSILIEFLLLIGRAQDTVSKNSASMGGSREWDIYRTINWLEHNIERKISLSDLAREARMSVTHFCRKFKDSIGKSPLNYLILARLRKVKFLLTSSKLSVDEIAFQSGFCDSSYLIKVFKKNERITPNEFRERFSILLKRQRFIKKNEQNKTFEISN